MIHINLEENQTNIMTRWMQPCGEQNWISNLLKKNKKNKNAAPWIIRPVYVSSLNYNMRVLYYINYIISEIYSAGVRRRRQRQRQSSGGEREQNRTRTEVNVREDVVMFGSWRVEWRCPRPPPPPRLSNASLERMINASALLASSPLYPNQTLVSCSTDPASRQINKQKKVTKENKKENKNAFSSISAFIQPGYHGDRYGFF